MDERRHSARRLLYCLLTASLKLLGPHSLAAVAAWKKAPCPGTKAQSESAAARKGQRSTLTVAFEVRDAIHLATVLSRLGIPLNPNPAA